MTSKAVHQVLYNKYKQLLLDPKNFFAVARKEHSFHPAIFFLVILTIFTTIINIIITIPLMLQGIGSFSTVTWAAQFLTLLYLPMYAVVQAVLATLIMFAILFLFKTKYNKFVSNFKIVAYAQTISLIYTVVGTVFVLAAEILTGQSINEMLLAVFSGSLATASAMAILYLILAIPLTIASWVHTLWAMMYGVIGEYDIKKHSAVLLSITSLLLSFLILVFALTQIQF
ncbi:hypothetical protein CL619_01870 [archaeon]|nr:hypothetical protein [archaeon]|tara:strand:+ start:2002 stop:2685 length:684 start_codon:yes stop_codon:yes gene_type:complete